MWGGKNEAGEGEEEGIYLRSKIELLKRRECAFFFFSLIPLRLIHSKEVYTRPLAARIGADSYNSPYLLVLPSVYWFICSMNSLFRRQERSVNVLNVDLNLV